MRLQMIASVWLNRFKVYAVGQHDEYVWLATFRRYEDARKFMDAA